MKTIIFSITTLLAGLLSFAKNQNESVNTNAMHKTTIIQTSFSTSEIIKGYITIKNALVKSDSKTTTQTAENLEVVLNSMNVSQLTATQKTAWDKIAAAAKKQTKTIASNNGKLDKQRMAFQQLSTTIYELVTTFGTTQKLYQDFCPMYEGGSIWLSETKDIKNPYYGAQMLTCGKLKETIE